MDKTFTFQDGQKIAFKGRDAETRCAAFAEALHGRCKSVTKTSIELTLPVEFIIRRPPCFVAPEEALQLGLRGRAAATPRRTT